MINQVKLKALTHWSIVWCGINKNQLFGGAQRERRGWGTIYKKGAT
jgi:hypothetical protein